MSERNTLSTLLEEKIKIMLFQKIMSIFHVGSARIDLLLGKNVYYPGECVTGHFCIKGGLVHQEIKRLESDLIQIDQKTKAERVIGQVTIHTSHTIKRSDHNQIPFRFTLPQDVGPSSELYSYRFKTRMICQHGTKRNDQDFIHIQQKEGNQHDKAL